MVSSVVACFEKFLGLCFYAHCTTHEDLVLCPPILAIFWPYRYVDTWLLLLAYFAGWPRRVFTRRRSFAKYWKYFVVHFNDVHAFGCNSAGSGRIWMKFGELVSILFGADPGRFWAWSAQKRDWESLRKFCFFFGQVNDAWPCRFPVSQISRNLHTTWFCDVVNPFGKFFFKFALKDDMQRFFVKVNCWSYAFNIIQSIWVLRNIKDKKIAEKSVEKCTPMISLLFTSDDVVPEKHNETAYWMLSVDNRSRNNT